VVNSYPSSRSWGALTFIFRFRIDLGVGVGCFFLIGISCWGGVGITSAFPLVAFVMEVGFGVLVGVELALLSLTLMRNISPFETSYGY